MSEHIDFELSGDRRLRLTSQGDLLVPKDTDPRLMGWLLQPLPKVEHAGKAEAGYHYAEVALLEPGSLPALREVLDHRLKELGLEGRTEPPLPPEDAPQVLGDSSQDVNFDA